MNEKRWRKAGEDQFKVMAMEILIPTLIVKNTAAKYCILGLLLVPTVPRRDQQYPREGSFMNDVTEQCSLVKIVSNESTE